MKYSIDDSTELAVLRDLTNDARPGVTTAVDSDISLKIPIFYSKYSSRRMDQRVRFASELWRVCVPWNETSRVW